MSTGLVHRVGKLIGIEVITFGEGQAALQVILQQKRLGEDLDGFAHRVVVVRTDEDGSSPSVLGDFKSFVRRTGLVD